MRSYFSTWGLIFRAVVFGFFIWGVYVLANMGLMDISLFPNNSKARIDEEQLKQYPDPVCNTFPSDGMENVPIEGDIVAQLSSAQFIRGHGYTIDLWANDMEGTHVAAHASGRDMPVGNTVLRFRLSRPLAYETVYKAVLRGVIDPVNKPGSFSELEKEWSFTSQSRYARIAGILPAGIRLGFPSKSGGAIQVESIAGAFPQEAAHDNWEVFVRTIVDGQELRWNFPVQDDGSIQGSIGPFSSDQYEKLLVTSFILVAINKNQETVARIALGPMLSPDGRTVAFVRNKPFRIFTADGAMVVFNGTIDHVRFHAVGSITVQPNDDCMNRDLISDELEFIGCWQLTFNKLKRVSHKKTVRGRRPRRPQSYRPGIEVLFPIPDEIGTDKTIIGADVAHGNIDHNRSHILQLRSVFGVAEILGRRLLTAAAKLEVTGCDNGHVHKGFEPSKLDRRGLEGRHVLLAEKNDNLALVVGSFFPGKVSGGTWFIDSSSIAFDPDSPLGIAAASVPFSRRMRGDAIMKMVIPVIANEPYELIIRDIGTGWLCTRVPFEPISRINGTLQYIGNLDARAETAYNDQRAKARALKIEKDNRPYQ